MPCRPNGGILVSGLRFVESQICIRRTSASGKRAFIAISGGPILPGSLPSAIAWQARQLPLDLSITSAFPSTACAAVAAPDTKAINTGKTKLILALLALPDAQKFVSFPAINSNRRINDMLYSH
jgi:hypothetical protein